MATTRIIFIAALGVMLAQAARAEERCYAPMRDWHPREDVLLLAAENGWEVRRIKIDDGCYRIYGWDSEGAPIEVTVHPATLRVMELEFEEYHEGPDRHEREDHD